MIKEIAALFGVPFYGDSVKNQIYQIFNPNREEMTSRQRADRIIRKTRIPVKFGGDTYSLGQIYKNHFLVGGDILSLNIGMAREILSSSFAKGDKVTQDIYIELENSNKGTDNSDIFSKIEKLAELKKAGLISENEFQQQKARILNNF